MGCHGGCSEGSPRLRQVLTLARADASRSATLASAARPRCFLGSLASTVMAAPQGPVCELRLLTIHRYTPGSTKGGAMPCQVEHLGRRGKPVKRQRFIPAERAYAFARKLQGTAGCTVSVC